MCGKETNNFWLSIVPAPEIHFAHPKAAGEPPRAEKSAPASTSNASKHVSSVQGSKMHIQVAPSLRGLTNAYPPIGQGKLLSETSHAEKVLFFFKESPCISGADIALI